MENLSKLLERFAKVLNRDAAKKEAITRVVEARTKVVLNPESISLKDGVLQIDASPVAKNEIYLKEADIKSELAAHGIFISRILYK